MNKINPDFSKKLKDFGAIDINACYNCGNCTATCPLSEGDNSFPRKMLRYSVLGTENKITCSLEPWLCYYCGECSESCPREANPGELMMSLRRYLISIYDWTGIGKLLYKSKIFEIAALIIIAAIVLILYILNTTYPIGEPSQYIGEDGGVLINNLASWKKVHVLDWTIAGILAFLLITNIFNMWRKVILNNDSVKVSFKLYFKEFFSLVTHFTTQKNLRKCGNEKNYWLIHLYLMWSYTALFIMIVFFLEWFQTDTVHAFWHPQRLIGYLATIGLFIGIVYFISNRIKKLKENSKYSHYTDWAFLILLFFTTLSGILMHIFRVTGLPAATYITYLVHLMILVPMLVIEVPFSKWSHLAYRPFAIFFSNVIERSKNSSQ